MLRGDLQSNYIVGDTWSPTASMRTLKYFLADSFNHKSRVHQLDCIGELLQSNVKHRVFLKLYSRYGDYFPECCNYFVIPLRLNKSICGMTNYGQLFSDDITNLMIDVSGFKKSQFQISIYYKYTPGESNLVVLSYVDDCVFWFTYE